MSLLIKPRDTHTLPNTESCGFSTLVQQETHHFIVLFKGTYVKTGINGSRAKWQHWRRERWSFPFI